MGSSTLILALIVAATTGNSIPEAEVEKQNTEFETRWNEDFVWSFEKLPTEGGVPEERIPYSGYIYLDKWGGTMDVLNKYDRASDLLGGVRHRGLQETNRRVVFRPNGKWLVWPLQRLGLGRDPARRARTQRAG